MDCAHRTGFAPRLFIAATMLCVPPVARAESTATKPAQIGQTPYSIEFSGSDTDKDSEQTLIPGDSWRKSLSFDAKGVFGNFARTEFGGDFTQAWRDPESSFALQATNSMQDASGMKAVADFHFTTQFLRDRITLSSSRTVSAQGQEQYGRTDVRGASEQYRFKADILRLDSVNLSVEGGAGRVDADYWDPTNAAAKDPLQKSNQSSRQLKSILGFGRFELSAVTRQSNTVAPTQSSAATPHQSEVGASASVKLSDLRYGGSSLEDHALALLPDSIWIGRDVGSLVTDVTAPAASTSKISTGGMRKFDAADVSVSYWQSSVRSGLPAAGAEHRDSHGLDLGCDLHFRDWWFSGNMSLYSANDNTSWGRTGENSMSGSLLAKWSPTGGPELAAGISSYSYGYAMFDYAGLQADNLWRYEFTADLSKFASASLNRDVQLKLMTSFQLQSSQSQWGDRLYQNGLGSTFVGFRLGLPLHQ